MTKVDPLVEFINAQLDEDQRDFEAALELYPGPPAAASALANYEWCRRMLRAVEWKRKLLTVHGAGMDDGDTMAHECPDELDPGSSAYGVTIGFERDCLTLRLLATEWSTHEVYLANREKWKP